MHCARCFFYEGDVGDDVCQRCGRAFMPEANVYLGLMLLVTGGAAWTLRSLLTASGDPFVRPAATLDAWATWPVSLVDRPVYGFVIGGWLAMLAAAPVLTAIMYGKRGGWLMAIVIALVGPDAGLAAAAAAGVWLAGGWTLRLSSKLASALLGLAPSVIYWFAATATAGFGWTGAGAQAATDPAAGPAALAPALRSLAYVPPITALIAAAGASALVVAVGRADRWHVRWPALLTTVLVVAPVLAVPAFVGIDEVRYGLLNRPEPPAATQGAALLHINRLQDFLARHPASPRAAEIRARLAQDAEQMELGVRPGTPPRRSEEIWQELLARHPDSVWAADARLHLGDAAARQGLFVQAEEAYRRAVAQTAVLPEPAGDPLAQFTLLDLFSVGRNLKAIRDAEHLRAVRTETFLHLAAILENRKGTQDNSRALALYFVALGLRGTNLFRASLQAVLKAEPGGPLSDNVAYDLAAAEPDDPKDMRRIEQLTNVITVHPGTDGALLARVAAARSLVKRAGQEPAALREAQRLLTEAQADLARRRALSAIDPYVAALADSVEKELVYVQAQRSGPQAGRQ